jgi:hypothetical protein
MVSGWGTHPLGGMTVRGGVRPSGWCSSAVGRSGDPSAASGGSYGKRWRRGGGSSTKERGGHAWAMVGVVGWLTIEENRLSPKIVLFHNYSKISN